MEIWAQNSSTGHSAPLRPRLHFALYFFKFPFVRRSPPTKIPETTLTSVLRYIKGTASYEHVRVQDTKETGNLENTEWEEWISHVPQMASDRIEQTVTENSEVKNKFMDISSLEETIMLSRNVGYQNTQQSEVTSQKNGSLKFWNTAHKIARFTSSKTFSGRHPRQGVKALRRFIQFCCRESLKTYIWSVHL